MSNQILISSGAKLRDLDDVIIGTDGVLSSLAFNVANGVPKLDENGKILVSQLPNSVMEFKGVWSAATNTPTLANGTGNAGDVYLCNVAGTVDFGAGPIAFAVGDYAVYTGTVWARSSGATGTVTSVGVSRDGNALAITGSPITTSGTINLGFSGDNTQYINGAGNLTTFPTLITSIGLTMPAAFNVSNSPLTANGTIGVTAAGYPSQYIRGDGTLADFTTTGGGGSSVSYYFNGGTSQGTIGGTTYYEMSKTANTGAGVDFSKSGDGLITAFLTDAGDPALLQIPAGNWNYEIYASMSANGGTPELYAELYVYDGTTFTLISTSTNEILYDGTNLNLYTFAMAVPETTLTVTDRLAIKLYSTNSGGKTTTVHTQDSHLCQVITTFTTGLTALNGLTAQVQYFGTGTSGSDFNIVSSVDTHTFNLPTASATKRGALSSADWSTFNGKQDFITAGTTLQYFRGDKTFQTLNTSVVPELTNLYFTDARARAAISLTTTGSSGASTYSNITGILNVPTYTLAGLGGVPTSRTLTINSVTYDLSADRTWTITAGISSVSGTAPISVSTVGGAATVSIATANTTTTGALTSTDWNTFNNKQAGSTNLTSLSGLTFASTSFVKMTAAGTFALDTNTYALASALGNYLLLTGGTMSGGITITNANDTYTSPASTNVPNIYLYNSGTTATANSVIALRTNGATGGDPFISWDINGVLGWSAGIDNSDSDKFKISKSWSSIDTNTYFTIDTSGNSSFAGTVTATSFIKSGGTSSQFLMADGSVDSSIYAIGLAASITNNTDLNAAGRRNGMYRIDNGLTSAPTTSYWSMIQYGNSSNVVGQLASEFSTGETYIRAFNSVWSPWRKLWDNVNLANPQSAITLTTTGSSGASSFSSNTLNVPNYTLAGLGGLPLTGGTLTNTGGNQDPILRFASSATSAFQWITQAFNATMGSGNAMVHFIGQAASTKNSGYLGYVWSADQSDSNFLTLGFFNNDHLFRLYANGNLGVGVTSNAGYKLDINGTGRFASSGSASVIVQRGTTSTGATIDFNTSSSNKWFMGLRGLVNDNLYIYNQTAALNNLILDAGNGSSTFNAIDATGSRTNPFTVMTIVADNNSNPYNGFGAALLFKNMIYSGGPSAGGIRDGARIRTSISTNSSVNQGTELVFDVSTTGNGALTEIFRIGYDYGAVINTSVKIGAAVSGGGTLQVNGNVNINGVFQINGVTIGGGGGSGVTGSGTTNYLPKWSGSTSLGNSVIYDNGTNISIGSTANSGTKLQVYSAVDGVTPAIEALVSGNGRFQRALRVLNSAMTAGTDLMLSFGKAESSRNMGQFYFYWAGDNSTSSRASIGLFAVDDVLNVFGSGNVTIGTTTDNGYKLNLNGSISFAYGFLSIFRGSTGANDIFVGNDGSRIYIGGNTYVVGNVTATGGFFDTSDARLKTLVEDNYLLSSIANVKAKLYKKDGRMELGYYAQDLENILPSAVKEGSDGFLSLSYAQVHTAKIAVIEDEVTILKNRVSELETKIQKYEA